MGVASYRAESDIVEYLRSLGSVTHSSVLKPSEWIVSNDGDFVYVDWPEREGSFSLANIWQGMKPTLDRRLVWARQFVQGCRSLDFRFARFFLDTCPRISEGGDLYLDPDHGLQKFFQHLRPTRQREGLPWSFLLTSSQNRKIIPVVWLGFQLYGILSNGGVPLAEKFRLYLATVPPTVDRSPVGEYPSYQPCPQLGDDLNGALAELVSVRSAYRFSGIEEAFLLLLDQLPGQEAG